jgi:hypothetical protein
VRKELLGLIDKMAIENHKWRARRLNLKADLFLQLLNKSTFFVSTAAKDLILSSPESIPLRQPKRCGRLRCSTAFGHAKQEIYPFLIHFLFVFCPSFSFIRACASGKAMISENGKWEWKMVEVGT